MYHLMAALRTLFESLLKSCVKHGSYVESESRKLSMEKVWVNYNILEVLKCGLEVYTENENSYALSLLGDIIYLSPDSWTENLCGQDIHVSGPTVHSEREYFSTVHVLFRSLIKTASLPVFSSKEHHNFDRSDFPESPQNFVAVFKIVYNVLQKLFTNNVKHSHIFLKLILPDLLIPLIENLNSDIWTSDQSCDLANKIMENIISYFSVSGIDQLFQIDLDSNEQTDMRNPKSTVGGKILYIFTPNLSREKWKYYPGLKTVFFFCLSRINFPDLSDFLEVVLPPSLLLIDDYMHENKVLGLQCVCHIIRNVSAEELRWYSRADVIFEALKHQLYNREVPVIEHCHKAILAILKVLEKSPENVDMNSTRVVNRYDEILQIILQDADGEDKIALRRAYTSHLDMFVDRMGITVVRHSNRLLRLIRNYLEVYDGPEETSRLNVLKTLENFIRVAWPRMENHADVLVKSLLKFMYDIVIDDTATPEVVKNELISRAKSCLILLKICTRVNVRDLCSSMHDTDLPQSFKDIMNDILTAEKVN